MKKFDLSIFGRVQSKRVLEGRTTLYAREFITVLHLTSSNEGTYEVSTCATSRCPDGTLK